jgi:hypothetical protein
VEGVAIGVRRQGRDRRHNSDSLHNRERAGRDGTCRQPQPPRQQRHRKRSQTALASCARAPYRLSGAVPDNRERAGRDGTCRQPQPPRQQRHRKRSQTALASCARAPYRLSGAVPARRRTLNLSAVPPSASHSASGALELYSLILRTTLEVGRVSGIGPFICFRIASS